MNDYDAILSDRNMEQLKDIVESFPLACYFLKRDKELTILYGNAAFYSMLQQSRDDVRYKYKNCLSSLLSTEKFFEGYQEDIQSREFLHDAEVHNRKHRFYTRMKLIEADGI